MSRRGGTQSDSCSPPRLLSAHAVEADIERFAATEAQLIIAATSYSAGDANSRCQPPARSVQEAPQIAAAVSARSYNLAHGVLGGFMTDKRAARNAYCEENWDS